MLLRPYRKWSKQKRRNCDSAWATFERGAKTQSLARRGRHRSGLLHQGQELRAQAAGVVAQAAASPTQHLVVARAPLVRRVAQDHAEGSDGRGETELA